MVAGRWVGGEQRRGTWDGCRLVVGKGFHRILLFSRFVGRAGPFFHPVRYLVRCSRWPRKIRLEYPIHYHLVYIGRPARRSRMVVGKICLPTHNKTLPERPLHSPRLRSCPTSLWAEMENAIAPAGKAAGKTVCFDCSKREIFTPSSGLKVLRRRLQTTYKVTA